MKVDKSLVKWTYELLGLNEFPLFEESSDKIEVSEMESPVVVRAFVLESSVGNSISLVEATDCNPELSVCVPTSLVDDVNPEPDASVNVVGLGLDSLVDIADPEPELLLDESDTSVEAADPSVEDSYFELELSVITLVVEPERSIGARVLEIDPSVNESDLSVDTVDFHSDSFIEDEDRNCELSVIDPDTRVVDMEPSVEKPSSVVSVGKPDLSEVDQIFVLEPSVSEAGSFVGVSSCDPDSEIEESKDKLENSTALVVENVLPIEVKDSE